MRIRLRRMGSKKDAFYRVVVSDSRKTPTSRVVDTVGYYDPGTDPATVKLDAEKIDQWLHKGAHPSDTVRSLIEKSKAVSA